MALGIKLQKRDSDFFISYGHDDRERVKPLVDLLKRDCGLRIWFDETGGNAAVRSSQLLDDAIGNARGAMFCVSEAWKQSSWCRNEFEVALMEQRNHTGFEIVCLRLDDVETPEWLKVAETLDMHEISSAAVARLLKSLSSDVPNRFDNTYDTYLAAPWSRPSPLVRQTFAQLRRTGWRLVGDTPNQKHLGERRIESIQHTTRGVVAILPYDPSQPEFATSPFILQEARLAAGIRKRLLLLMEPGVQPPSELVCSAFRSTAFTLTDGQQGVAALAQLLDDFEHELQGVAHTDTGAFIFFAGSLRDEPTEAEDIVAVIERASNVRCLRGERVSGNNVQSAITDLIRRAAAVIADVSDDNRNTLIEAGIAMGAGTPLKLMCRALPDGSPPKKRFMFEGQELYSYRTPEQRFGLCYHFARQFRRQVYIVR